MATQNAINLSAAGVVSYDGAGSFSGSVLTQHYALVAGASNAITSVNPGATAGVPMISGGAGVDPSFGVALVPGGGSGLSSLTAYAVLCGGTTSTGNMQQVSGLGTAGQVLTSAGAGALPVWSSPPIADLPWTVITAATQAAAVDNGYIANATSGGVEFSLPGTAGVGQIIRITGLSGGSGWSLTQPAGVSVQIGASTTTVGTGGSLASTGNTDSIHLVCAVANTTWICISSMGNISVV